MCLDIRKISETKSVYYKATEPDPRGSYFHVATEAQLVYKTISVLCNNADYELPYNNNILTKSGKNLVKCIRRKINHRYRA
ncbi:hypothetical protein DPMN_105723 [Dreissena polymorpha]|uniref:Uncharacterized protein n=1 Tax=Dreissena polymorpha TaxID=45954 RepID=A0A9D4K3Q7_DREPO|nr:hypothetical protein DPMN_105723 [Dreissena polymorpha]